MFIIWYHRLFLRLPRDSDCEWMNGWEMTRNDWSNAVRFSSCSRDQQHRTQQQLHEHRGFGRRSRRSAAPAAAADRLQGRRSILPGGQHSSSSRSSSAGHGGADPVSRTSAGRLPRASASASAAAADSQWTAVLDHADQDLDRPEEEEQYVSRRHITIALSVCLSIYLLCLSYLSMKSCSETLYRFLLCLVFDSNRTWYWLESVEICKVIEEICENWINSVFAAFFSFMIEEHLA